MKGFFKMNFLEFLIKLLGLISFDIIFGFLVWILYKYIDFKYFSALEIVSLKEENKYLKQENKKINGVTTFFDEEDKL